MTQLDSFVYAEDCTFSSNPLAVSSALGDCDVLALSHCDLRSAKRVMSATYDDPAAKIQRLLTHQSVAEAHLLEELAVAPLLTDALGGSGGRASPAKRKRNGTEEGKWVIWCLTSGLTCVSVVELDPDEEY